nr:MAG TPA: hypothetical protein [Crassvirales sp.]
MDLYYIRIFYLQYGSNQYTPILFLNIDLVHTVRFPLKQTIVLRIYSKQTISEHLYVC